MDWKCWFPVSECNTQWVWCSPRAGTAGAPSSPRAFHAALFLWCLSIPAQQLLLDAVDTQHPVATQRDARARHPPESVHYLSQDQLTFSTKRGNVSDYRDQWFPFQSQQMISFKIHANKPKQVTFQFFFSHSYSVAHLKASHFKR